MSLVKSILPSEQRRMKLSLLSMLINYALFTIGIFKGVDFSDLGAGLAMVNAPILTFLIGESIRPTGYTSTQTTTKTTAPDTGDTREVITNE